MSRAKPWTSEEVSRRVVAAAARVSGVPAGTIDPRHTLLADLDIDSVKTIELLCELEERFELEIDERDVPEFESLTDVVGFVSERLDPEGRA